MNLRQRTNPAARPPGVAPPPPPQTPPLSVPPPPPPRTPPPPAATSIKPYNIIPVHNLLVDHPSHRSSEVRAAASALRDVADLRKPPLYPWLDGYDLLDWLGLFFGFQQDNVRNQREHLVLHLANLQMRLNPPPKNPGVLEPDLLRRFRRKLLQNYESWCSYIFKKSKVRLKKFTLHRTTDEIRRELLYVSLYLLIWGEAANLRFCPECLCFIFHNMADELNKILDGIVDPNTGMLYVPFISGENSFLNNVVRPIYDTIRAEVGRSNNGTKPHSAWRNYDDINEYFWRRKCLSNLKWPLNRSCNFFLDPNSDKSTKRVGKTGFVEQRSFWNVYRCFDRLWVLLILFFQAAMIVAWDHPNEPPWKALESTDTQVKLLTVFISWSTLRLLQSILDAGTQYSLVTRENKLLGVRMVLKSMVAATWIIVFSVFYSRIWSEKNRTGRWSNAANTQILVFLKTVFVFVFPEMLALLLFVLPWIRNFLEGVNFLPLYLVTWWFHTRIFVGRGVREGLFTNIKYTLFWVLVLASKFIFSYFLQIRPLVTPSKALMKLKGAYNWHEFFNSFNRVAVVLLWLPVLVIYLMDIQIWYSIFTSIFGACIGLFSHLGEIRNTAQLRLRFQFFAGAMQFNLMSEEQHLSQPGMTVVNKLRDAVKRVKLRYGLGQPYKKIESDQVEATRFALIWNEIIIAMREEDLVSDRELELLELPQITWGIRVLRWPCVLLCNELLLSVSQAKELAATNDSRIWLKLCKNEYRRCAVIEAYDSIKFLLLNIVKVGTDEYSIITNLFRNMDNMIAQGTFSVEYNLTVLPKYHEKIVALIEVLLKPEKNVDMLVNMLQALYEISIREFPKTRKLISQLRVEHLAPPDHTSESEAKFLFEDAIQVPDAGDAFFYRQLRRLHTILTSRDSMHNVPVNREARRRIAFFSNSLFMNIPHAPLVEKMMAFTILTPYYDEEVMYASVALQAPNEDGVSTLFYLQKIYEDEWNNFVERMRREGVEDERKIVEQRPRDLRLWASYRGQTLSRTVRGMMYYYRALEMLAFLDSASEVELKGGMQGHASYHSMFPPSSNWNGVGMANPSASRNLNRAPSGVSVLYKGHEYACALMKFSYVVACQMFGVHKTKGDPRAEEILYLMKNNEALRVAYVDEVHSTRGEVEYYSVLVKYDQQIRKEVEIYRIKLPGPLKLGEGKPENQNHALIFTRGDAVQTIDMNQDNYFEEALKMRNLLEEFNKFYGLRRPTILGVRENIFTGSVSSLAWFMSAQETSFVTLGQRVLANPLKVRMHYGHPDVFDRFWFLTRGGVSKASKVINISEDIFAGFNCTLRGGNVTHHEYIQVGKGRDVGLNQISMFEAKVSSGNGEQVISRDIYRLGHKLDFFRMLSVFYSTVGFYFNSMLVVLSVYLFLWGRLYLALSGVEKNAKSSTNNAAMGAMLNQQFVIQLGLFTALPMIVENSLEHGFLPAIWDFLKMQLQLSSVFYTFSLGTRTHYFGRTILHGGAKYRATGRGFVVQHKSFSENYRLYARSHFVKAIELGVILVIYAAHSPLAKDTFVYIAMTISSWFLVMSWVMAPFVFNPSGFDWLKTVYDFEEFVNWIWYGSGVSTRADQSWETWWYEEQDHLRTTGLWGKLLEILLDLRFFFFQYSVTYQLKIVAGHKGIAVYFISWIYLLSVAGIFLVIAYAQIKYAAKLHLYYRLIQLCVIVLTVLVMVLLLKFTQFELVDLFTSLLAIIPTGWGVISIAQVLRPFLQTTLAWTVVVSMARLYDMLFGVLIMIPVALMSWMPGFQSMQTRILFNEAFSRGLQISQLLTAK